MSQPHSGTCRCADCQDIDSHPFDVLNPHGAVVSRATDIGGAIREAVKVAEPTRTEAFEAAARKVLADYPAHSAMVAGTEAEQAVLDADQVAKACCDLAWRNGWVLTYKLARRGLK